MPETPLVVLTPELTATLENRLEEILENLGRGIIPEDTPANRKVSAIRFRVTQALWLLKHT